MSVSHLKLCINKNNLIPAVPKYKCDICEKLFTRKNGMDRHRVMHFDERAQKCDECGRAFKRKEELARHMKIHTNDRPSGDQTGCWSSTPTSSSFRRCVPSELTSQILFQYDV